MVYFGDKRVRGASRGLTAKDRRGVLPPLLGLIGVVVIWVLLNFGGGDDERADLPSGVAVPREAASNAGSSAAGTSAAGNQGSATSPGEARVVEDDSITMPIAPVEDVNTPAKTPFEANPLFMLAATDDGSGDEALNEAARMHLFWRWRAGPEIPIEPAFPALVDVPSKSDSIRGKRYELVVQLDAAPFPRMLDPNDSGIKEYWETWAHDDNGLYRILFYDKNPSVVLDPLTEWTLVADYLRLHQYERVDGSRARVPEFVAARFVEPHQIAQREGSWLPLFISTGVGIVAIAFVMLMWLRGDRRHEEGQYSAARRRASKGRPRER